MHDMIRASTSNTVISHVRPHYSRPSQRTAFLILQALTATLVNRANGTVTVDRRTSFLAYSTLAPYATLILLRLLLSRSAVSMGKLCQVASFK